MVNISVVIADGTTETTVDLSSYGFTEAPSVYPVPAQPVDSPPWVTDRSATAFTLHVLNPPFGEAFTFNCWVFAEEDLGTVVYGSLAVARRLCNIEQTDDFADDDLTAFLNIAAQIIDDKLGEYEDTLPLSIVPDEIAVIANFYAAGLFMQRNSKDEVVHPYFELAALKLSVYMERVYGELGLADAKVAAETAKLTAEAARLASDKLRVDAQTALLVAQKALLDAQGASTVAAGVVKSSSYVEIDED